MRQKVALAGALIHEPKLIILDEPLTGLDAGSARQVKSVLRERVRAGGTVIMTTHILEVAERMADRIGVIAHGRLIAEGTLDELRLQASKDGRAGAVARAGDRASLEDTFLALRRPAGGSGMIAPAGSTLWFAEHEWRLAWRDWLAMMSGGRRKRLRRALIAIAIFVLFMHFVAYWMVGRYADAAPDKATLVAITGSILLSWLLMISQAMESTTRAFYARSDLDLILASPVAAEKIFAVRIATVALSMAMMALPLAAPFIDILIARGGWRWLGAYGLIAAMGAAATALAVGLSVALFRTIGARRTRFVAQVVAAVIGAAFVIGLQIAAILSYGTISRVSLLQSQSLIADMPSPDSLIWWPARAALGDGTALLGVLAISLAMLAAVIAIVAPRFGEYAITAAGVDASAVVEVRRTTAFRASSPRRALRTQGMDAVAARSLAGVADADADALSHSAGCAVVAELR